MYVFYMLIFIMLNMIPFNAEKLRWPIGIISKLDHYKLDLYCTRLQLWSRLRLRLFIDLTQVQTTVLSMFTTRIQNTKINKFIMLAMASIKIDSKNIKATYHYYSINISRF